MTTQEFERIKNKISELNERYLKTKGVCEQIQENWKNDYGFETVEEARVKLTELQTERDDKIARREKLMNKLESMYDWENL